MKNNEQGRYISTSRAMSILNVRFERITWFIATGELSAIPDPQDRSKKVVSLQDVRRLCALPHLLAPWVIYALVDPRELKKGGFQPRMQVLEGVNGTLQDADARERVWIRHCIDSGAELTNIQYMS